MILTTLMTVMINLSMLQMDEQSFIEYVADMEECYCEQ